MSAMRILLVLPRDGTYRYGGFFRRSVSYAPLTLTTLAALVPPELGADIEIVDEGVQQPRYDGQHYDVVGITCVAASAPRAYELAAYFRRKNALVVLGGSHPTLNPEEASRHADVVVTGYAEETWPRLLRDVKDGKAPRGVLCSDAVDRLPAPVPRRDLQPRRAYARPPSVIAARGCRNHCSYCSIQGMCRRHICARPIEEVVEEIRCLGRRTMVFLDPNIAADRGYAVALMEALIPLNIRWVSAATISIAQDRMLVELLRRSGCMGLLVGIESVSQQSLNDCGKHFNRVERYARDVQTLQANGVAVMASFMLGFDGDTESVFDDTLAFIDDATPALVRFGVLTPFPGTREFRKMREDGRILSEDWGRYDMQHVVFQPNHMTPETLQRGLCRLWTTAFSVGRMASRVLRGGRRWALSMTANVGLRYYGNRIVRYVRG